MYGIMGPRKVRITPVVCLTCGVVQCTHKLADIARVIYRASIMYS